MLKFNPDTNVIFDNDEAAVAPIREITRDEVPDLIANGASVDASANVGEQTSSSAATGGDAPAAQDPAASVTGSDTAGEAGNVTGATDNTKTSGGASQEASSSAQSTPSYVNVDSSGTQATGVAASEQDAPEPVVTDAQADPGGAGSSDLNPKPAAPNLDAQAASAASSDAVPLAVGGGADSAAEDRAEEDPLTIIAEIEALLVLVGNAAVHEYQRIIQRLADLKNHPKIKAD